MTLVDDFFKNIIPASLEEPIHASLELQDGPESITAIVIPRLDGGLMMDFYDAMNASSDLSGYGRLQRAGREMRPVIVRFRNDRVVEGLVTKLGGTAFSGNGVERPAKGRLVATQNRFKLLPSQLKHARFCIEDFPMFRGASATYPHTTGDYISMLGRSEIDADGWQIIITESAEADKDELGITHTGEITRINGSDFSVDDLNHLRDGLTQFLSFITGVYRTSSITIGHDSDGRYAWGRIGSFNQSKYINENWFNPRLGASIAALFPGFWHRYKKDEKAVRNLIGLYTQSSMIAQMRLALYPSALKESQSALEGLSKLELCRGRDCKEPASKYITTALCQSGIEYDLCEIPGLMSVWQEYKNHQDDNAGPTFITRLRNKATHPLPDQTIAIRDYREAWRLSQRYVELMLLKLFDYRGEYRDRLTGETKSVPWAVSNR